MTAVLARIVISIPVEGAATATLDCQSFEEQIRLAVELDRRDLLGEVVDALRRLADELAEAES